MVIQMAPRNEFQPLWIRTSSGVPVGEPYCEQTYSVNYDDPNGPREWVQATKDSTLFLVPWGEPYLEHT